MKKYKIGEDFLQDLLNLLKLHGVTISEKDIDLQYAIGELVFLVGKDQPGWTTNIAEDLSCGYGDCDMNGFFEFPVRPSLTEDRKKWLEKQAVKREDAECISERSKPASKYPS